METKNFELILEKQKKILLDKGALNCEKAINQIRLKSFEIFKHFYEENKKNILLIGKVQSGKTSTFLSYAFLALENGVDCIFILTGTKNSLKKQTYTRLKKLSFNFEDLKIYDEITDRLDLLKRNDFNKSFIFVINKNPKEIKAIKNKISNIKNKKFLIIDDEVDHASQDNETRKSDKKQERNPSPTNAAISDLLDLNKDDINIKYLGATATPTILLFLKDWISLRPDIAIFINPNEGYTGLNFFHNQDGFIKILSNNFSEFTKQTYGSSKQLDSQKHENYLKEWRDILIFHFFKCVKLYKKNKIRAKMIINLTHKQKPHNEIFQKISNLLRNIFKSEKNLTEYMNNVNEINKNEIKEIIKFWKELEIFGKRNIDKEKGIFANQIKISILNACSPKEIKELDWENFYFEIIIGGENLSRGLTINNLITSVFIREPKKIQIDTTLQRARWFGYRENLKEYIHIFTNAKLDDFFYDLKIYENSLWKKASKKYLSLFDLESIVIEVPKNSITDRQNFAQRYYLGDDDLKIITFEKRIDKKLSIWLKEKFLYENKLEQINKFKEKIKFNKHFKHSKNHNFIFEDVNVFLKNFENLSIDPSGDFLKLKKLKDYLKKHQNKKIRIIYILKRDPDNLKKKIFSKEVSFKENDEFPTLFRGQYYEEEGYVGDKNLVYELKDYNDKEFVGDFILFNVKDKYKNEIPQYYFAFVPIPSNKLKNKTNTNNLELLKRK